MTQPSRRPSQGTSSRAPRKADLALLPDAVDALTPDAARLALAQLSANPATPSALTRRVARIARRSPVR